MIWLSHHTCFSVRMTIPSSWSSSPFIVTVKSMIDVLADTSGVYAGLASLVVTYRRNPVITSTSLSPTFTYYGKNGCAVIISLRIKCCSTRNNAER